MAETSARNDPFVTFRFEVKFDDLPAGGFSECSGLSFETEVRDYAEGGVNSHLHKFPHRAKLANLLLKQGIVSRKLWDWHYDQTQGKVQRRNGSILVHDPSGGAVVMEWRFVRAFPCKWSGPELNAAQNSVAVEVLEICHEGLERKT